MVDKSPVNFILRNFIVGIIILSSVAIELCLARLLQIWIPLKKQEFKDLCSVSNISVFILDGLLHGYYIHGHSPIGKADVNYDDLFTFLNEEGRGTIRNRGLENDNDDDHCKNQCYEMFISHAMRTIYDGLYIIQNESMLAKKVNTKKFFRRSKLGMRLFRNYLNYEKDQTMLDNYMNNQLKTKIDIVSSNIMQYIKDKTILQRIFGYTIDNSEFMKINAPDIIFYRDYGQKFDDVLFCGMEWEWFIMDLYFFQMLMIYTDDKFISMFCTFIFDFLLYYIRIYFGNKNVAKKAVVDDRFLN
jgi:meckelin